MVYIRKGRIVQAGVDSKTPFTTYDRGTYRLMIPEMTKEQWIMRFMATIPWKEKDLISMIDKERKNPRIEELFNGIKTKKVLRDMVKLDLLSSFSGVSELSKMVLSLTFEPIIRDLKEDRERIGREDMPEYMVKENGIYAIIHEGLNDLAINIAKIIKSLYDNRIDGSGYQPIFISAEDILSHQLIKRYRTSEVLNAILSLMKRGALVSQDDAPLLPKEDGLKVRVETLGVKELEDIINELYG